MRDEEIVEQVAARVWQRLQAQPAGARAQEFERWTRADGRQDDASCATCTGRGECHRRRPVTTRRILDAGACRVSARYPAGPVENELAPCIDHTLLKPEATRQDVEKLCDEARRYQFASVCLHPIYVPLAARRLAGSGVAVCTVVGFPQGAHTTEVKVFETRQAIDAGASEIDMVIHVGTLKSGDLVAVRDDIQAVAEACGDRALLKVIIEAALLTDAEKVQAAALCKIAGADFVKTSTGFGPGGATLHDVELLRRTVGQALGVKAAGGIRDRDTALQMIRAGADRIGASASIQIVRDADRASA